MPVPVCVPVPESLPDSGTGTGTGTGTGSFPHLLRVTLIPAIPFTLPIMLTMLIRTLPLSDNPAILSKSSSWCAKSLFCNSIPGASVS